MKHTFLATLTLVAGLGLAWARVRKRRRHRRRPQQPSDISTTISGEPGTPPRFAVPAFIALSADAETAAVAKTIGDVLWDDLNFEREFAFIPRDVYSTIPAAKSFDDIPFDRWRELNADGVMAGTVQKAGNGFQIQVRLFDVKTRRQVFGKEYSGSSNARLYAHTISDDIHLQQRALRGVARTKLAFDSDRDGERLTGTVENRGVKEIYTADYDGENQRRLTTGPNAQHQPRVVARRPLDRVHLVAARPAEYLRVAHLRRDARRGDQGAGRKLAAGLVARRHAHRLHVDPRRQLGDLRRQPRRLERAAADEPSGHRLDADLVAVGHADRVHVRSLGLAADLPGGGRRAGRRAAADVGVVRRSADVVAGALQRNRVYARAPGRASTSRSSTSPRGRSSSSPSAKAATRARRTRPTAGTSRSCPRGPARRRSSPSRATART